LIELKLIRKSKKFRYSPLPSILPRTHPFWYCLSLLLSSPSFPNVPSMEIPNTREQHKDQRQRVRGIETGLGPEGAQGRESEGGPLAFSLIGLFRLPRVTKKK
jgi:hypothetical protein